MNGESSCRVLIVDDSKVFCMLIKSMLEGKSGIEFRMCFTASEAMEAALAFEPTVILQDLMMPDVEGMEMVRLFKSEERTKNIPLVVLSAREDASVKAAAFSEGANDYLVKTPDPLELRARVWYHSRAYQTMMQRDRAYRQIADDLRQAAVYVQAQLPVSWDQGPVKARWLFKPSSLVGGDIFGYWKIDESCVAMYLLDTSGHGVGSCLLSVSVADTLRRHTLPGVDYRDPGSVLEALATIYPMDEVTGKYFTIWYGVYEISTRQLIYSGAGHPPALLVRQSEGIVEELESEGPFIGLAELPYGNREIKVGHGDRLYLFSDGVYEIRDHQSGRMWEFARLKSILQSEQGSTEMDKLEELKNQAEESQGSDKLEDDFAIIEFQFD